MPDNSSPLRRDLGRTDFTLLVIGAVVGVDVYVVAAMGASSLGPAQLVAWVAAGALAAVIALAFVQCAAIDTDVGGSYTYARTAFGPLAGFLAGWALYAGEFVALPIFPLAFTNYLDRLVSLPGAAVFIVRLALILAVTSVNLAGVRKGALLNDFLTVAKLLPLAVLIILALVFAGLRSGEVSDHLRPFTPLGWSGFGAALLPIFWAYAGFELAVLPAGEVRNPRVTLPLGLIAGMGVATVFYLLTAFAVVGALPWQDAAASSSPLAAAMDSMMRSLSGPAGAGVVLMSLGALVSIAGVYDVFTLGVARLSYALSRDGLFPAPFSQVHGRFGTPHVGLAFQAVAAIIGVTLFDLRGLITISVFFLGLAYVLTALAALRLVSRHPSRALHLPGLRVAMVLAAAAGAYLASQAPIEQIGIGAGVMLAGLAVYSLRNSVWRRAAAALVRGAEQWAAHDYWWLLRTVRRLLRRAPVV